MDTKSPTAPCVNWVAMGGWVVLRPNQGTRAEEAGLSVRKPPAP